MKDESTMNIEFSYGVFIPNSADDFSQVKSGQGILRGR